MCKGNEPSSPDCSSTTKEVLSYKASAQIDLNMDVDNAWKVLSEYDPKRPLKKTTLQPRYCYEDTAVDPHGELEASVVTPWPESHSVVLTRVGRC